MATAKSEDSMLYIASSDNLFVGQLIDKIYHYVRICQTIVGDISQSLHLH